MKILFLAPANSNHTQKWAGYFISKGYDVHVISLTEGNIQGATLHILKTNTNVNASDFNKLSYLFYVKKISKITKAVAPDIVSVHYATSYGGLAALSNIKNYSLSIWGSDVYHFPQKSFFHKLVLKYSLHRAHLLLSTSKAMALEAKKYTRKDFVITPFGVDTDLFNPQKRTRNDNLFVFGNIKSLSPVYGIELIIKAASLIKRKRPDIKFQVRIAGKGPYEVQYKKMAIEEGVDNIVWLGFIPQEQAAVEWANFDVAVIPSYRESFGVSALEAQASSIPVIITDVDGLKEATIPNQTSIVVNKGDAEAIADSLIFFYDNKEVAKKMGAAGRLFVKSTYEYEACFNYIENTLLSRLNKTTLR